MWLSESARRWSRESHGADTPKGEDTSKVGEFTGGEVHPEERPFVVPHSPELSPFRFTVSVHEGVSQPGDCGRIAPWERPRVRARREATAGSSNDASTLAMPPIGLTTMGSLGYRNKQTGSQESRSGPAAREMRRHQARGPDSRAGIRPSEWHRSDADVTALRW